MGATTTTTTTGQHADRPLDQVGGLLRDALKDGAETTGELAAAWVMGGGVSAGVKGRAIGPEPWQRAVALAGRPCVCGWVFKVVSDLGGLGQSHSWVWE